MKFELLLALILSKTVFSSIDERLTVTSNREDSHSTQMTIEHQTTLRSSKSAKDLLEQKKRKAHHDNRQLKNTIYYKAKSDEKLKFVDLSKFKIETIKMKKVADVAKQKEALKKLKEQFEYQDKFKQGSQRNIPIDLEKNTEFKFLSSHLEGICRTVVTSEEATEANKCVGKYFDETLVKSQLCEEYPISKYLTNFAFDDYQVEPEKNMPPNYDQLHAKKLKKLKLPVYHIMASKQLDSDLALEDLVSQVKVMHELGDNDIFLGMLNNECFVKPTGSLTAAVVYLQRFTLLPVSEYFENGLFNQSVISRDRVLINWKIGMIKHLAYKFETLKNQCLLFSGPLYDGLHFDTSYNLAFKPDGKNICRFTYKECVPGKLEYGFMKSFIQLLQPSAVKKENDLIQPVEPTSHVLENSGVQENKLLSENSGLQKNKPLPENQISEQKPIIEEEMTGQVERRTRLSNDGNDHLILNTHKSVSKKNIDEETKRQKANLDETLHISDLAQQMTFRNKNLIDDGLTNNENTDKILNSNSSQHLKRAHVADRKLPGEESNQQNLAKDTSGVYPISDAYVPLEAGLVLNHPTFWSIYAHVPMKSTAGKSEAIPDCSLGQIYNSFVDFYSFVKFFLTFVSPTKSETPTEASHAIRLNKYFVQTVRNAIDDLRDESWQHYMDMKSTPFSPNDANGFNSKLNKILDNGLEVYFESYPFNSKVVTASVEQAIMKDFGGYLTSQTRYFTYERFIELEHFKQRQRDMRIMSGAEAYENPGAYLKEEDDDFKRESLISQIGGLLGVKEEVSPENQSAHKPEIAQEISIQNNQAAISTQSVNTLIQQENELLLKKNDGRRLVIERG